MNDRFAFAAALRELGTLLELLGENPFKVRAYERGARAIEELGDRFEPLVREGRLTEIEGIGQAIAEKAATFVDSGSFPALDKARADVPRGLPELAKLPGLGPKRAKMLVELLGIGSVDELKRACELQQVRGLKGFGEKMETNLLAAIAERDTRKSEIRLADARAAGAPIVDFLKQSPAVKEAALAGSVRRWKETVSDLDIVVATDSPAEVAKQLGAYPLVKTVEGSGDTKTTVRLASGLQVDVRYLPPVDFATALHHFTGSKAHHTRLRGLARDKGLTISEWGVTKIEGGEKLPIGSEADLYKALDLPFIPPELREDQGEFEAAAQGDKFDDLIELADLRGLVHCHTTASDGRATLEEMARGADALGMQYLTITDHSQTAAYAGGLKIDRMKQQWDEIAEVQEKVHVRLLRGTESDILEDGSLDFPDAVLEQLDVIVASVHQRHALDENQMTERLVRTMRLPQFKIWGHALGRLLLEREPFVCRVEEVLDALAAGRGAVEINGDPKRLDLAPRWARKARERGLKFTLSVDAHSVEAMGNHLPYAVAMAKRAGIRKREVLNALDVEAFRSAVRPI